MQGKVKSTRMLFINTVLTTIITITIIITIIITNNYTSHKHDSNTNAFLFSENFILSI